MATVKLEQLATVYPGGKEPDVRAGNSMKRRKFPGEEEALKAPS